MNTYWTVINVRKRKELILGREVEISKIIIAILLEKQDRELFRYDLSNIKSAVEFGAIFCSTEQLGELLVILRSEKIYNVFTIYLTDTKFFESNYSKEVVLSNWWCNYNAFNFPFSDIPTTFNADPVSKYAHFKHQSGWELYSEFTKLCRTWVVDYETSRERIPGKEERVESESKTNNFHKDYVEERSATIPTTHHPSVESSMPTAPYSTTRRDKETSDGMLSRINSRMSKFNYNDARGSWHSEGRESQNDIYQLNYDKASSDENRSCFLKWCFCCFLSQRDGSANTETYQMKLRRDIHQSMFGKDTISALEMVHGGLIVKDVCSYKKIGQVYSINDTLKATNVGQIAKFIATHYGYQLEVLEGLIYSAQLGIDKIQMCLIKFEIIDLLSEWKKVRRKRDISDGMCIFLRYGGSQCVGCLAGTFRGLPLHTHSQVFKQFLKVPEYQLGRMVLLVGKENGLKINMNDDRVIIWK